MSAWLVSRTHIAAIVQGWRHYFNKGATPEQLSDVGQMLWSENVESLRARYPNDENPAVEYGIHKSPKHRATPGELGTHLRCLRYQSCEHDGWEKSAAYALLRDIAWALMSELPGSKDAPWGLEDE